MSAPEITLTSPEQAQDRLRRDDGLGLELRRLRALNTVEEIMETRFRGETFRVGFADPPLGGCEAWLETAMVPFVLEQAEAAGWEVDVDGSFVTFTSPGLSP